MRLLVLAGTLESVQIAHAVSRESGVSAVASVARTTALIPAMNMPVRVGGWGGSEPFAAWIRRESIDAILDATHPFAARISMRTADVARDLGISYVQFLRPAWTPGELDSWTFLNTESDAASQVPADATVLLATGRRNLDRFENLNAHKVLVRVQTPGGDPFPFRSGAFIHRPVALPVSNEMAGLRALGVDYLVTRNTGGGSAAALVEAAGRLGLPVGMIRRPPQPEASRIRTVSEALSWVRRRKLDRG